MLRALCVVPAWLVLSASLAAADPDDPVARAEATPPRSVGSTLSLGAGLLVARRPGGPSPTTSHVVFVAQWAPGLHVAPWARVAWPLLAREGDTSAGHARVFGLAAALGANVYVGPPSWRLRPFVGAALGLEWLLSETSLLNGRQGEIAGRPGVVLHGTAGVRVGLLPRVGLLFAVEVAQGFYASRAGAEVRGLDVGHGRSAGGAVWLSFDR